MLLLGACFFLPEHVALAAEGDTVSTGEAVLANILTVIANVITALTNAIGQLLLILIEMMVIPILQYNAFSESNVIGLGWALVRNVVNMFVVVILLVISVLTIVGDKRVNWQQNIPSLLVAVILVNFSRTICGFFIDISQVIMFTFVNALLDIAAGNFAGLLGLNNFGEYSTFSAIFDVEENAGGISASAQLGAAYLQFILYVAIAVIMFLLALAFLWRIVVLWILVIMSPLAFFLGGIKGIFGAAAGANSQWWGKFSAALTMGPLLTFFLWLSLAAASSGGIAKSEFFPLPETPSAATLQSFQTDQLTSVLLGLVLLVVGMQQAASAANSLGGMASWAINEKMGKNVVSGVARVAGLQAIGYTGARAAAEGGRKVAGGAIQVGAQLGKVPIVGGFAGRAVVDTVGAAQQRIEAFQKEGGKAAKERISRMTDDQKAANLKILAEGRTGALNISAKDDIAAMQTEIATNANLRKKNADILTPEQNRQLLKKALQYAEKKKDGYDDAQKDKLNKFKSEQAHILDDALGAGALAKHIDTEKFNPRDLSSAAAQDPKVLEALKKKVVRTLDSGDTVNAYDELMRGAYGADLRKNALQGRAPAIADITEMKEAVRDAQGAITEPARPYTAEELANAITADKLKPSAIPETAFTGPNRDSLVRAVIDKNSVKDLQESTREAMVTALDSMPPDAVSIEDRAKVDRAMLDAGDSPALIGLMPVNATTMAATLTPQETIRVEQILKQDPAAARHFAPGIALGNWNDITKTIAREIQVSDVNKLAQEAQKASDPEKQKIREALEAIRDSIDNEIVSGVYTPAQVAEMSKTRRSVTQAQRYVI